MRTAYVGYQTIATNIAINPVVPKSLECPYPNPIPLTSSPKRSWNIVVKPIKIDHNGYHGFDHWMRVLYNGRLLAGM
jgi:hypothetical protein